MKFNGKAVTGLDCMRRQKPRLVSRFAAVSLLIPATVGCGVMRQWCENGFKLGPNYHLPRVSLPDAWPEDSSVVATESLNSPSSGPTTSAALSNSKTARGSDSEISPVKVVSFDSVNPEPPSLRKLLESPTRSPSGDPQATTAAASRTASVDESSPPEPMQDVEGMIAIDDSVFLNCWWMALNDPKLDELIQLARNNNLDLRKAAARIGEARSQKSIIKGNLFPQSQNTIFGTVHGHLAKTLTQTAFTEKFDIWALGPFISWEIDLWGRLRRNVDSAQASLQGRVEDYRNVMVVLTGDVATSYIDYRYYQGMLASLEDSLKYQDESIALIESKVQQGFESNITLYTAKVARSETAAQIPSTRTAIRQARNRICVLLGLPVQSLPELDGESDIPEIPAHLTVGIPADLLRRRPDIRAAERAVAAQSEQIGIAMADLYPSFSLAGFFGTTTSEFSDLLSEGSFTGLFVPGVSWKILNYGRLLNNIDVQDSRLKQSVLAYQQTVLRAGEEVDSALVSMYNNREQLKHNMESVKSGEELLQLRELQFNKGEIGYDKVLDARSQLSDNQRSVSKTRHQLALGLVMVYRSMGGGWNAATVPTCK